MASIVASMRGSSAGRKPDDRHHEVGRVQVVGAERLGERAGARRSSRRAGRSSWISSRVALQPSTRSAARSRSASAMARSSATQHMTFEYRKCAGSPRTSQMPWSFSCQRTAAVSAQATRNRRVSSSMPVELVGAAGGPRRAARRRRRAAAGSRRRCRPAPAGCRASPPGGQLPLGEVVLAADAEHDLQRRALPDDRGGGACVMNAKKSTPRRGRPRPTAPRS